jgi:hypothetical protein
MNTFQKPKSGLSDIFAGVALNEISKCHHNLERDDSWDELCYQQRCVLANTFGLCFIYFIIFLLFGCSIKATYQYAMARLPLVVCVPHFWNHVLDVFLINGLDLLKAKSTDHILQTSLYPHISHTSSLLGGG